MSLVVYPGEIVSVHPQQINKQPGLNKIKTLYSQEWWDRNEKGRDEIGLSPCKSPGKAHSLQSNLYPERWRGEYGGQLYSSARPHANPNVFNLNVPWYC